MLKHRAVSFPLLLILLGVVVLWQPVGRWFFLILSAPIAMMATREMAILFEKSGVPVYRRWCVALTPFLVLTLSGVPFALPSLGARWGILGLLIALPVFAAAALFFLLVLLADDHKAALQKLAGSLGLLVMVILPLASLIRLYFGFNALIFLMVVLVTKAGDTGGYIVGCLANQLTKGGNHPIVPSISPRKSWEGTCGGMLFSVAVALLFCGFAPKPLIVPCKVGGLLLPTFAAHLPTVKAIGIAVLTGVVLYWGGFAGDLTESCIKRAAGVKDSGHCIPGMGGVLDVLDSFLYNAPLWFLLTLLQLLFRF